MIAAFFALALSIFVGVNTVTINQDGISATWRYEPFSNAYVVTVEGLPNPPLGEAAVPISPGAGAARPSGPGLDGVYGVLQAFWPEQPDKAMRVVGCETGGTYSTTATAGPFHYDGRIVYYIGWFQVDAGIHGPVPADAWGQAAQGRRIYDRAGGWSPWPVCGLR